MGEQTQNKRLPPIASYLRYVTGNIIVINKVYRIKLFPLQMYATVTCATCTMFCCLFVSASVSHIT